MKKQFSTLISSTILLLLSACSKEKEMKPFENLQEALSHIESYDGEPEDFELPISDSLNDSVGRTMAVITDKILGKNFEPNGYDQKDGYRIYKYKSWD